MRKSLLIRFMIRFGLQTHKDMLLYAHRTSDGSTVLRCSIPSARVTAVLYPVTITWYPT